MEKKLLKIYKEAKAKAKTKEADAEFATMVTDLVFANFDGNADKVAEFLKNISDDVTMMQKLFAKYVK